MQKYLHSIYWLAVSAVIVIADQWTKIVATNALAMHDPVPVFSGLNWFLTHNYGVAFSLFNDQAGWQRYGLSGFAIIVVIVMAVWLVRLPREDRYTAAALALVIGGAVGNVIDRLRLGYVVDFVDLYYGEYHWPAFNIADSAICVGAVLIVLTGLLIKADPELPKPEVKQ